MLAPVSQVVVMKDRYALTSDVESRDAPEVQLDEVEPRTSGDLATEPAVKVGMGLLLVLLALIVLWITWMIVSGLN
jgi:hypothetical protein